MLLISDESDIKRERQKLIEMQQKFKEEKANFAES